MAQAPIKSFKNIENPIKLNSPIKPKKSNHFFTNIFLLEEKDINKDKVKEDINKTETEERKDDLVKPIREMKNSENPCMEIPLIFGPYVVGHILLLPLLMSPSSSS